MTMQKFRTRTSSACVFKKPRARPSLIDDVPEAESHFETQAFYQYTARLAEIMKRIQGRDKDRVKITLGMMQRKMGDRHRKDWDLEALSSLAQIGTIERVRWIAPSQWIWKG